MDVPSILLLAALWGGPQGGEHSVALPPNFDPAKCVECHTDIPKGKHVHTALSLGCTACHTVETEGEKTKIGLAAPGNELCITCHADKRTAEAKGAVHAPVAQKDCTTCHNPHASANEFQLAKPTAGDAGENLCLTCHGNITAQMNKAKRHGAVDLGCSTCHTTHKSEPAGKPEGIFHLAKPEPKLCLDCHDASDAALRASHLKQPFAGARCAECHNPHGSDQPKLLNNYIHPPFAEKQCDACHQEPKDGRIALQEGGRRELCLVCHTAVQERLDKTKFTHTALGGASGCVSCHSPHAATYPHQVRRGPVELCLECHSDLAKQRTQKAFLHAPVFELSCLVCHQEHTGERPKRLRADVTSLCLECHGPKAIEIVQGQKPVALFNGQVTLPPKTFSDMKWLRVTASTRGGHPYADHPFSSPAGGGQQEMTCLTCHLPHAANGSRELLVTEQANTSALCVRCHK